MCYLFRHGRKGKKPSTPENDDMKPFATKQQEELELEAALAALSRASLRQTKPRRDILQTMIGHHGPYSVEEWLSFQALAKMDRVTMYRCLSAFEKIGLVQRCEFGDGVSRYEYARGYHHHHIVCRECGTLENIHRCVPKELLEEISTMGYHDITHSLEFFGTCKKCVQA